MGLRRIIVLLVAVVAAGATAMYARSWIQGQQSTIAAVAAPAPEQIYEVLVADANLAAGTFIKPQHLRWQRWPTDDVPDTYVLKGARPNDAMVGAVVRRGISEGTPITDGSVVKPGDRGFLAAVLAPGMRAVSVPINAISSNSGLIFPGDRVDLILTQTLSAADGANARRVSETVLRDVRIIAMGVETSDVAGEDKNYEKAKTATFEVEPSVAEKITLLTELGKLSLSLRSLANAGPEATPSDEEQSYTWDLDVSRALRSDYRLTSRLLVLRGSNAEDVQLQQGAN
ncbi:MAG TPA: Flp pilus assembly protein CpaB [Geminicoccaceae bacterium]|nr:Flp pilus assembly protein CpaB [Geminicoccaceae bacterium]